MPINTDIVPVDQYCEGERWCVNGEERLAETLALIAIAQQLHAAKIVRELLPTDPLFKNINVFRAARKRISRVGKERENMDKSQWLLFD